MKFNKKIISAAKVKDLFLGREGASPTLVNFMDTFFKERVLSNTEYAITTIRNYRATIVHVNAYLEHSGKKRITLRDVDEKFIKGFDSYLLLQPVYDFGTTLRRNSINKYLIKLKVMTSFAHEEKMIRNFKLKDEPSTRTFLTF